MTREQLENALKHAVPAQAGHHVVVLPPDGTPVTVRQVCEAALPLLPRPGDGLLLAEWERERFATYLERDAASGEQLAEQAAKLSGPAAAVTAKKYRAEALAQRVVAKMLRDTQSVTVGR